MSDKINISKNNNQLVAWLVGVHIMFTLVTAPCVKILAVPSDYDTLQITAGKFVIAIRANVHI